MNPAGFQILSLPRAQVSLAAVLKCGQSFRWAAIPLPQDNTNTQPNMEYRLCLRDRVVCLRQDNSALFYRSVFPDPQPTSEQLVTRNEETLHWLRDYFQLDVDLPKLYQQWAERDKVFASMQDRFGGIRMLRQDPWETLICFICSSNNNIARITKMVSSLCRTFSPPLLSIQGDAQEEVYHAFPPPSALATDGVAATLRSLGFGYRAEFIHRTAKMLVENHGSTMPTGKVAEPPELWLRELREVPTEQARQELLNFVGVGRKVADCILLMSLDKREVVPVDTHVHQIAIKHYGFKGSPGKMTPQIYDKVATKFAEVWGEHAGWAHSVLFTADLKSFSSYGLPTPPLSDTNGGTPRQPESPSDSQSENPRSMATGSKKRQLRTADLDAPRPRTRRKRSYI